MAAADDAAAFVPAFVRDWAARPGAGRVRRIEGSLALVDLSGFTALAEALARAGRIGAEQLTEVVDARCAELLAVTAEEGATPLAFGGDALLLLTEGPGHAERAARAAGRMRDAVRAAPPTPTPEGPVRLRISCGVHSGEVVAFLAGDRPRQLVVAGPAASEVVRVEGAAEPDTVRLSDATAQALGGDRGPLAVLPSPRPAARPTPAAPVDDLSAFVPPELHAVVGAEEAVAEHRRVAVGFVGLAGLDRRVAADPHGAADDLDRAVGAVQAAARRHGVTVLGADVAVDGAKLLLASGAPTSVGDEAERLLLTARDIVEADAGLAPRVGAHIGPVFSGPVGDAGFRTFTVMGDAVNLAARLLGHAGAGEVLATPVLTDEGRARFRTSPTGPLEVRGKRAPVEAVRVGALEADAEEAVDRAETAEPAPLVGRDDELARLRGALDAARHGRGSALELVGEAGSGKTRLIEALVAEAGGVRVRRVAGRLHRRSTPYATLRRVLREALGVPVDADAAAAGAALERVVATELPDLADWTPFLAVASGARVAETEASRSTAPEFRRQRLHQAVAAALARRWSSPTLLVADDLQWSDEASVDLLRHLAGVAAERPWLVCLTSREATGAAEALALEGLDDAALTAIAVRATADAPPPPHQLAAAVGRAAGNPRLLHEILVALRRGGTVEDLPESIGALLAARVDRLPPRARTLLRRLAVLGQEAPTDLAESLIGGVDPSAWDALEGLVEISDGRLRFTHTALRDVAYEGLPFRERRTLHGAVADRLADAEDALRSLHLHLAGRHREAWERALAAARDAEAAFANEEAARLYERARRSAAELEDLPSDALAAAARDHGRVLTRLGDTDRARKAYAEAVAHGLSDPVAHAELLLEHARVEAAAERHDAALATIDRALEGLAGRDDAAAAGQRAELHAWRGHFCQELGRHDEALAWAERARAEAEAADSKRALAHAYRLTDAVHAKRGDLDRAVHSEDALAIFAELDDLPNQAALRNNLGAFAYWLGRWDDAREHYAAALDLDERIGDVIGAAYGRNNLGEILLAQGRLDEAADLLTEAERVFRAAGHRSGVAFTAANLGSLAARAGEHDRAEELLAAALRGFAEIGARHQVDETRARRAEALALHGDAEAALALVDDVVAHGQADAVDGARPLLLRVRGLALRQLGDDTAAERALRESLASAEERAAGYDAAMARRALGELAWARGEPDAAATLAEAGRALATLGVRRLPVVPPADPATADPAWPRA